MVDVMGTLQVRDVPDEVSHALKARAAEAGQSLSEYVLGLLRRETSRPTLAQWMARVASRPGVDLEPGTAADAVRAERGERDDDRPSR